MEEIKQVIGLRHEYGVKGAINLVLSRREVNSEVGKLK